MRIKGKYAGKNAWAKGGCSGNVSLGVTVTWNKEGAVSWIDHYYTTMS